MAQYNHLLHVKLPKWVREEIEALTRTITRLEDENLTLRGREPKSNTVARLGLLDNTNFYLPNHTRMEFLGHKVKVDVMVHPEGYIRVSFDDAVIIPSARNCILITDEHNTTGRL